jgi:hypothetical protein
MKHTGTRVAKRKISPVLAISECGAMHRAPVASFRPLIAPVAWPLAGSGLILTVTLKDIHGVQQCCKLIK